MQDDNTQNNTQNNEVLLEGAHSGIESPAHLVESAHSGIPGSVTPATAEAVEVATPTYITIDDVIKVHIHVGGVTAIEDITWSDKLYKLTVDFGPLGVRTVLSGIKKFVVKEEIIGKQFPFVTNLAPRKIKDLESQAMILAADHGDVLALFNPSNVVPNGTQLH